MNIHSIDIFLIHNPEYFLIQKHAEFDSISELRDAFYDQLYETFSYCETAVENGYIQHYGISSNTFGGNPSDANFVDIKRCLEIANSITKNHHFSCVQCPLNLLETGAATNYSDYSFLQIAHSNDLGVLSNRSLNAFYNDQFISLRDVLLEDNIHSLSELNNDLSTIINLEHQIKEDIILNINEDPQTQDRIFQAIAITGTIHGLQDKNHNYDTFREALVNYVLQKVEFGLSLLNDYLKSEEEKQLIYSYYEAINNYLKLLSSYYKQKKDPIIKKIRTCVLSAKEMDPNSPLKSIAINIIRETKEVNTVLVGMRHEEYVSHVLNELEKKHYYGCDKEFWVQLEKQVKKIF